MTSIASLLHRILIGHAQTIESDNYKLGMHEDRMEVIIMGF